MSLDAYAALLQQLQTRFEHNMPRHANLAWDKIVAKLQANPQKLHSLNEMERTGGEPDVIGYEPETDEYWWVDCSAETPKARRSLCYDQAALDARKEHRPQDSACAMAAAMGVTLLTEQQYRDFQALGEFDLKSSSWIATPDAIRQLDGALFCDRRYGRVFTYHNGAGSYYAVRGFRGLLRV